MYLRRRNPSTRRRRRSDDAVVFSFVVAGVRDQVLVARVIEAH
jgi:hypothetical protein